MALWSSEFITYVCARYPVLLLIQCSFLSFLKITCVTGNTGTPALSQRYISEINRYGGSHNDNDPGNLDGIYLITEERWHGDTVLPVSLLPVTEGMSARSHHRLRQSGSGLDDAGMDLQSGQIGKRGGQEVSSTTNLPWIDWEIPFPVIVCAFAGAILFTFLFLLWLRKQMSSEKKSGDGDRRGLVEEGAAGPVQEKSTKASQDKPMEAQWVRQPIVKPPVSVLPIRTATEPATSSLPEVMSVPPTEKRPDPVRIKTKGLLERRTSSSSLTIELAPAAPESPPHMVTPTRECTSEEFLLSAGNMLSRSQLRRAIKNPASLHKEFWEVPLNVPERVDIFGAGVKNRYSGVLPNPQSRVVLSDTEDPVGSYINANYIRGYDGEENRFIATQGPLQNTVNDFWRMIWLDGVQAIVMMTRLYEASKTKCDVYFPLEMNSRVQTGAFTVIVNSIDSRNGFTIRDLEIRHEGERRQVTHYWYDSWPDHAVPQAADSLVSLANEVNTLPGPVVVHCSAGIGRTGCFIALATGMTQLSRDGNVDVLGILCQMRYDRGGMVQTAEQYEFVHKALCLYEQTLDSKPPTTGD